MSTKKKLNPRLDPNNWGVRFTKVLIADFPHCCGLKIITSLPLSGNAPDEHCNAVYGTYLGTDFGIVPTSVWKHYLKERIEWLFSNVTYKRKGILVSLNSLQNKDVSPVLKSFGFKMIRKFYHKDHNRDIFIYYRPPIDGSKVEKSVFGVL